jgi:hypothetical protein
MRFALCAAAAAMLSCAPAGAATITKTMPFSAIFAAGSPVESVAGTFTVTYTPNAPLTNQDLDAITIDATGPSFDLSDVGFSYYAINTTLDGVDSIIDFFIVSNFRSGIGSTFYIIPIGRPSFGFAHSDLFTGGLGTKTQLFYTDANAFYGSISPPGFGAIPEPGAWAMLLAGFGLMGASLRKARGPLRRAVTQ